jgi:hypothetical protein
MRTVRRHQMTTTAGLAVLITAASLLLFGPLHAQMKSMPRTGSMGMMGPMNMAGTVTMSGKSYDMHCRMIPIGKPKGMMGGKMGMGGMKMDQPMKMTGTMTMMGQKYRCEMVMTPANKGSSQ